MYSVAHNYFLFYVTFTAIVALSWCSLFLLSKTRI